MILSLYMILSLDITLIQYLSTLALPPKEVGWGITHTSLPSVGGGSAG